MIEIFQIPIAAMLGGPGGLIPIVIFAALALGGSRKAKAKGKPKGDCAPFTWHEQRVDDAIGAGLEAGIQDEQGLLVYVLGEVYPMDPEGKKTLNWPVAEGGDAAQLCIQDRVAIQVNLRLAQIAKGEADQADEDAGRTKTMPEVLRENEPVSGDGNKYPQPGAFYRVNPPGSSPLTGGDPENLSIIAKAALMNALQLAGLDPKMAVGDGADAQRLRVGMINAIECSPWNDALYGHEESHHYSAHPRGISLNAVHADNRARLLRGEKPRRAVTGKTSHDGTGGHLPYLWIPAVDPGALEMGEVVAIDGYWPNGNSGNWPPPEVTDLNAANVPRGPWGCEGVQWPL